MKRFRFVLQVYHSIARALGCIVLFFFANLLKTLAAKVMATSFHTEAHFAKMQEALQKVCMPASAPDGTFKTCEDRRSATCHARVRVLDQQNRARKLS